MKKSSIEEVLINSKSIYTIISRHVNNLYKNHVTEEKDENDDLVLTFDNQKIEKEYHRLMDILDDMDDTIAFLEENKELIDRRIIEEEKH